MNVDKCWFMGFILVGNANVCKHIGVSENSGTPKSSIFIGFSIINHPFWGTPIFWNTHICMGFWECGSSCSCQVLYVSGVPGTGKTASVLEVVRRLRIARTDSRVEGWTSWHTSLVGTAIIWLGPKGNPIYIIQSGWFIHEMFLFGLRIADLTDLEMGWSFSWSQPMPVTLAFPRCVWQTHRPVGIWWYLPWCFYQIWHQGYCAKIAQDLKNKMDGSL